MTVDDALTALYITFSRPPPASMATCPCPFCVNDEEAEHLLTTPLHELTEQDLAAYSESVFLTVGGIEDFKYLLPRLFDIWLHTDGSLSMGCESWLGKLGLAKWNHWPDAERGAIEDMILAWYDSYLARPGLHARCDGKLIHLWDGDDFICGLGRAGVDLRPYLEKLVKDRYAEQLTGLYRHNFEVERGGLQLGNAFWGDFEEAGQPLLDFLRREDVEDLIAAELAAKGATLAAPSWDDDSV